MIPIKHGDKTLPAEEYDRRVDAFSQALRDHGMRLTHQRLEIVREIAGTDEHPDVETVYRGVRKRVPTVSLDTVYRTLGTLAELGLVNRVTAVAGPARYDANTARHHHFVCTRCGRIHDIVDPTLDSVRAPGPTAKIGTVEFVEVHLRGVCSACGTSATPPTRDNAQLQPESPR